MSTQTKQYAAILGSHPELSHLELRSVLQLLNIPHSNLTRDENIAFFESTEEVDCVALMDRLGGTIKLVEMVGAFTEEAMTEWLFEQIDESSKFHFGFSLYKVNATGNRNDVRTIHKLGLALKRTMKADGISCRFVSSKEPALSSVIVHKERLLKNGVDIVIIKNGNKMRFGKTRAVQPFQDFSKRDYGRPGRDRKSGMLPPKVARMMLNIARPAKDDVIIDPFCGSGTVLIEALLMDYKNVTGADISDKAVADTLKNISWMKLPPCEVHLANVKTIDSVLGADSVDCIVAEGDLGRPRPQHPDMERKDAMRLYPEAITAMAKIMKPGARMVFAFPSWRQGKNKFLTLPLQNDLKKNGLKEFHRPIFYGRPHARVVRHIHFLEKK